MLLQEKPSQQREQGALLVSGTAGEGPAAAPSAESVQLWPGPSYLPRYPPSPSAVGPEKGQFRQQQAEEYSEARQGQIFFVADSVEEKGVSTLKSSVTPGVSAWRWSQVLAPSFSGWFRLLRIVLSASLATCSWWGQICMGGDFMRLLVTLLRRLRRGALPAKMGAARFFQIHQWEENSEARCPLFQHSGNFQDLRVLLCFSVEK